LPGSIGGDPSGGGQCKPADAVGDPILASTGNVYQRELDYASPVGLNLSRSYNSSLSSWVHNYMLRIIANSSTADVVRPDGKIYTFTGSGPGAWASNATVVEQLIKLSPTAATDPNWKFINADDAVELYDANGMPLSVTARNGRALSFTAHGSLLQSVTDAWGHSLGFTYDAQNRLTRVTTPEGRQIIYSYDTQGRLAVSTYPDNSSRQYLYENAARPLLLTGLVDENGNRFASWTYDAQGRAISATQAAGSLNVQLSYGAGAATVTDPLGTQRTLQFANASGRRVFAGQTAPCTNCYGDAASNTVDPATGLITQSIDYLGLATLFAYDNTRKLPLSVTRAAGRPESQTVQTQWHATWRLPVLVTEAGRSTAYTYDGQGNKLSETVTDTASGTARTWAWSYTGAGLVASETAPNGGVTQYAYDSAGNATSITNALGHVTALQYDTAGRLTQSTAPTSLVTTYGYDARGRLLSHNRGGLITSYTYTPSGQVASASQPSGYQLSYSYDPAQRLIGWADNRGAQGEFTLDAMGNRTLEQIKQGSTIVWQLARSINSLNRISSETLGVNQARSYGYNANGDKTSDTNGLSQGTSYALDGLKRVTAITNAANATAQLTYNALDGVTAASDFKGAATGYARDAFGGATQEASPDAGTRATQYDSLGLPSQITDALGQATAIQRDSLGRPTQLSFADGKSTVLRYDLTGGTYNESGSPRASRGYLSEIIDASGTTQYKRDLQGRVIVKSQLLANGSTRRVRYSYTAGGQLDILTYPNGGRLQHLYDATGRLAQLNWNDKPLITGISWNPLGQPTAWTWAFADNNDDTSIPASRSYDSAGRLTATEISSYQYDAAGRITSLTQELYKPANSNPNGKTVVAANVTWSVGYDAAGRIVSFGNGTSQASFSYDANGNRLTSVQSTGTGSATQNISRAYSVDGTGNKLLGFTQHSSGASGSASTSIGYQYNANGDLIHDGLRSYGFNAEGRLSSVTTGNTTTAPTTRYAHNALGQRVFKTEPLYPSTQGDESDPGFLQSLIAFFSRLWNPGASPAEQLGWVYVYGEDGSLLGEYGMGGASSTGSAKHIYLPTASGPLPIAALINGRKYAVHTDHLNTPRRLSQANGKAVWQWAYSAFGEEQPTKGSERFVNPQVTPNAGTTNLVEVNFNLRYPGQYFDQESGLYYNYFRSYDARTGRYTQPDPIGLDGGWNRFLYVEGNPLSYVDPLGLDRWGAEGGLGIVYTQQGLGKTIYYDAFSGDSFEFETRSQVARSSKPGAADPYSGLVTYCERGRLARAYGTTKMRTTDSRSRWIHGGGSGLSDPWEPQQGWKPTEGCTRAQNEDVENLCTEIDVFKSRYPKGRLLYRRD
jgi:RHS repeat-associated protein